MKWILIDSIITHSINYYCCCCCCCCYHFFWRKSYYTIQVVPEFAIKPKLTPNCDPLAPAFQVLEFIGMRHYILHVYTLRFVVIPVVQES